MNFVTMMSIFFSPMVKLLKTFEAFFQYVLYNTKPDLCACRNVHSLLLEIIPQSLRQKDDVIAVEIIMKLIIDHLKLYKVRLYDVGQKSTANTWARAF